GAVAFPDTPILGGASSPSSSAAELPRFPRKLLRALRAAALAKTFLLLAVPELDSSHGPVRFGFMSGKAILRAQTREGRRSL
ncbi:hypothetical protein ONR57_04540, partial [Hoyosella sp. YIM 151337]|uniref:hypothetical protein n=1 Tax=Hoyosella sp. YIM 151337 TaxID=2992742 RepID=UPI0022357068